MASIVRVDPNTSTVTLNDGRSFPISEMTDAEGYDVSDVRYARTFSVWTAPANKGGELLTGVVSDFFR